MQAMYRDIAAALAETCDPGVRDVRRAQVPPLPRYCKAPSTSGTQQRSAVTSHRAIATPCCI